MHTIALKLASGKKFFAVAGSKTAVMVWKEQSEATLEVVSWRYHDGSGWADGSEGSWEDFNGIVGQSAIIVI